MTPAEKLQQLAYENGVNVYYMPLHEYSLSVPDNIVMDTTDITQQEESCILAHELGHCLYAGFYNLKTPLITKGRIEAKADRWAIRQIMPRAEIEKALASGITEIWAIAEHFGVTEQFTLKALQLYGFIG